MSLHNVNYVNYNLVLKKVKESTVFHFFTFIL